MIALCYGSSASGSAFHLKVAGTTGERLLKGSGREKLAPREAQDRGSEMRAKARGRSGRGIDYRIGRQMLWTVFKPKGRRAWLPSATLSPYALSSRELSAIKSSAMALSFLKSVMARSECRRSTHSLLRSWEMAFVTEFTCTPSISAKSLLQNGMTAGACGRFSSWEKCQEQGGKPLQNGVFGRIDGLAGGEGRAGGTGSASFRSTYRRPGEDSGRTLRHQGRKSR